MSQVISLFDQTICKANEGIEKTKTELHVKTWQKRKWRDYFNTWKEWWTQQKTPTNKEKQRNLPRRHSSWCRRLSSSSSEEVFKTSSRRFDQDEYIRLTHTSSEDVFKTFSRRLAKTSSIHLQDIFKTYLRRFEDASKTSWRRLAKLSSRRFQDVSSS